jgi:hypothetical protein
MHEDEKCCLKLIFGIVVVAEDTVTDHHNPTLILPAPPKIVVAISDLQPRMELLTGRSLKLA